MHPLISKVVPVFVPSSFVETGGWPGPYATLNARGVALAWAIVLGDDAIQYVLHQVQCEWETERIDWKTRALQNLRERSPEPVGTGTLFRDNGEPWLVSLMYPDGLGPSRLLLTEELERFFPEGYRVVLPERSRAFAFASHLDPEEADTIDDLIRRNYSRGERPLSPEIFCPSDLLTATPVSTT